MAFSVELQNRAFVFVCECVSVCIGVGRKGSMALLASEVVTYREVLFTPSLQSMVLSPGPL